MPEDGNEQENLCDMRTRVSSKVKTSVRIIAHTYTGRPQREWQNAFSATSSLWIQRAKLRVTKTLYVCVKYSVYCVCGYNFLLFVCQTDCMGQLLAYVTLGQLSEDCCNTEKHY